MGGIVMQEGRTQRVAAIGNPDIVHKDNCVFGELSHARRTRCCPSVFLPIRVLALCVLPTPAIEAES